MVTVVELLGQVYWEMAEIGPSCPPKEVELSRSEKLQEMLSELRGDTQATTEQE